MSSPKDNETQVLNDEKAILLDHEYDGIRELDHPLPEWWLWLFYLTIAFSIFYSAYYMTGWGPTLREELEVSMKEIEATKPQTPQSGEGTTEESLLALVSQADKVGQGRAAYVGKCAACHGDKGQGVIGPNLTDEFWIHGTGKLTDIAGTIRVGVPAKGMPPWEQIMTKDEIHYVTAFIRTLRGTQPPGAKEPQGTRYASE